MDVTRKDIQESIKNQQKLLNLKTDFEQLMINSSFKLIFNDFLLDKHLKSLIEKLNISNEIDKSVLEELKSINYLKSFFKQLENKINSASDNIIELQNQLSEFN